MAQFEAIRPASTSVQKKEKKDLAQ